MAYRDRLQKAQEKVIASKANELKFGATVKKFEGRRG